MTRERSRGREASEKRHEYQADQMARGRREIEPCSRTYGFPIYCAGWVPFSHISTSSASPEQESEGDDKGDSSSANAADTSDASDKLLVVVGGGGGEGRSGVPNALVVSGFEFSSRSLSDQPVQLILPFSFEFWFAF